jgi:hypothetical protein
MKLGLPQIAHLATAGLGLIIFFVGFASLNDAPEGAEGTSFYELGFGLGWTPVLLFVAGLLSLKAILPGEDKKPGLLPPALVVATTLAFLFMVFSLEANEDMGAGGIMVMIFAILQLIVVVGAYLLDAGIIKMPAPNPYGHQPPGGMYPPSGQFQQPFPGQQPPQQQTPPGQATTFAPQQGQFGQPGQPGQPGQAPGTPPGGYPQQG